MDSSLVWPSQPERARIRHIQTFSSIENFQEKKGFFSKVLSFFTGGDKTPQWLVQPVGIAVSPDDRLYIADPGANGVHIIDQKERKYDFLRSTKAGNFLSPVGIAVADDGMVYVSDSQRGTIVVLDADHDLKFTITEKLQRPTGLAIVRGKLYVADAARHAIIMFDLHGKYLREFGQRGGGAGEFNFPVSIAAGHNADSSGIFIVDALNYRIQQVDSIGKFLTTFGEQGNIAGRFASPKSVAIDSDDNLYVTDALMDNIQIFNPSGKLLLIVGHSGIRDGEFSSPGGIAIDHNNRIYVVETLNRRIQVFQYLK